MTISVNKQNNVLTLAPEGRLDSVTADEFNTVLTQQLTPDVQQLVLDLKQLDFISSKGLRVLVSTHKKLGGGKMVLQNANASIQDVLKISGLLKIFTLA